MPDFDICIIGGGPAGISIVCKLKQLGFNVLLIAEDGPGRSMVQSLTPGVWTLLDTIRLGSDPLRMGCTPQEHIIRQWTSELDHSQNPPGFLVERREFDRNLVAAAKQQGINAMHPASVVSLRKEDGCWSIRVLYKGEYVKIRSTFLVDASGKKSVLRGSKIRVSHSTLAISGCWKNTPLPGNSSILESAHSHWIWGAMMPDGVFHATVFLDPALESIKGAQTLTHRYQFALESSGLFRKCQQGRPDGKLSTFDVTPYYYEDAVDPHFIKVGEANFGLDPISSQGVQTAISNAIQAAIVVNTIFSNPANTTNALNFYKQRQQEIIKNHLTVAAGHYTAANRFPEQLFWQKRIRVSSEPVTILKEEFDDPAAIQAVQFSSKSTLQSISCIRDDQITSRLGLVHPGLPRPIVFWDNKDISLILGNLSGIHTVDNLLCQWSEKIPFPSSLKLFRMLKDANVLESVNE